MESLNNIVMAALGAMFVVLSYANQLQAIPLVGEALDMFGSVADGLPMVG